MTSPSTLVSANLRLVLTMARRYHRRGHLELHDLIQEGSIGLITAAERFDPAHGVEFKIYARWWIRHRIWRAIENNSRDVRVPVEVLQLQRKLSGARRRFEAEHGGPPEDEYLAEAVGISAKKIAHMRRCLLWPGPSLGERAPDGEDGRTRGDLLPDDGHLDPGDQLHDARLCSLALDLVNRLPPVEADVLRKRFGLEIGEQQSLREIGEHYSLSRERIRQIQEHALGKLRREMRRSGAEL